MIDQHRAVSASAATILLGLALVACSSGDTAQEPTGLSSDMPVHNTVEYMAQPALLAEASAMCDKWKASSRPLNSIPLNVVTNCNSADNAKQLLANRKESEKLKRAMGI